MAVEIAYEELSGKAFYITELDTQKSTMQLCYAALQEANNDLPFSFEEMVEKVTATETAALKEAVKNAMNSWFEIPAVIDKPESEGADEKNA